MAIASPPQIDPTLLDIARCPVAVQYTDKGDDPGKLEIVRDGHWLYSPDSGYKYPVFNGIPKLLMEEGAKWKNTEIDDLPVPPPDEAIYGVAEEALTPEMQALAEKLHSDAALTRETAVKQLKETADDIRKQANDADPDGLINSRAARIAAELDDAAEAVATGKRPQTVAPQPQATPIGLLVFMFFVGLVFGLLMRRKRQNKA